jgi:hypothetical protein
MAITLPQGLLDIVGKITKNSADSILISHPPAFWPISAPACPVSSTARWSLAAPQSAPPRRAGGRCAAPDRTMRARRAMSAESA